MITTEEQETIGITEEEEEEAEDEEEEDEQQQEPEVSRGVTVCGVGRSICGVYVCGV